MPDSPVNSFSFFSTEESRQMPATLLNERVWPKISIVMPSLNQAEFIEIAIRSVLAQGYPNLEYIIIDGGSTDGTVEIIRKYETWLSYWVSEPDRGQSHALNKGFQLAHGEIMAYLNSDDVYLPHSLQMAVTKLMEARADILVGAVDLYQVKEGREKFIQKISPNEGTGIQFFPVFSNGRYEKIRFLQPGAFWRRTLWERTGEFDERYHYVMDREWFTRALAQGGVVITSDEPLARFNLHHGSKTHDFEDKFTLERAQMYWRMIGSPGFRTVPCFLEGLRWILRYSQDVAYHDQEHLRNTHKPMKAFGVLLLARFLRRLRVMLDLMAMIIYRSHQAPFELKDEWR